MGPRLCGDGRPGDSRPFEGLGFTPSGVVCGVVLLAGGDLLSLLAGPFGVVVGAVLAGRAGCQAEDSVDVVHRVSPGWWLFPVCLFVAPSRVSINTMRVGFIGQGNFSTRSPALAETVYAGD